MSVFSSYKKIFLLGFIVMILAAIPFSVYFAQKRQQITSKAAASTILSFEPASTTIKVNETLVLNIMLDPGGTSANQVSFVKLAISFDQEKFSTTGASLVPNPNPSNTLTTILEDPIFESGKASISLSIGADPTRAVTTKTKIAILQLKAASTTAPTSPNVTFDPAPNTQVLSIASLDQTSENVLSTTVPAKVTIISELLTSTPTPTPTVNPSAAPLIPTSTPLPGNIQPPMTSPIVFITPTPMIFPLTPTTAILPPETILPPTGPGGKILSIGILGVILTLVGGALLILL